MDKIEELKRIINESNNIVFFGGAGTSTDSGIKDFRGKDGLYTQKYDFPPEYYLSVMCFYQKPSIFYQFYKDKMNCLNTKPSIIHKYLYKLEKIGKLKAIITQNIDGLHQKAGSKNVIEIHGTIHENYCINCHKEYNADYIFNSSDIPTCECGGIIKPNVILYGEMLNSSYERAIQYISNSETLIVAGTSLTVEPACSLIKIFKGQNLIIINETETPYDNLASLVINDNLKKVCEILIKDNNKNKNV